MFEDENDDFNQRDLNETIARYEDMLVNKQAVFFDISDLEDLIEYYEMKLEFTKAREVLKYAMEVYPFSASLLTKKATQMLLQRNYKEALELLDRAERYEPNDVGIFLLRADIYLAKSDHKKALEIIDQAIQFAEDNEVDELWLEKADVYEDIGLYDKVYECLKVCLKKNPSNFEALSRMWYSVELADAFEDSIDFHKELIDRDPYSYLAWHNLGSAYFFLGLFEKSIDAYEYAIAINENYDLAYRECGDAYVRLKQYHKAIEHYQKAIEISKPYEELHYAIGLCYEKLKDYAKARQFYRKAINSDPKFHQAFYRIGITYKMDKQWDNAAQFYRKAVQLDESRMSYLLSLAEVASKSKDESTLRQTLAHILRLNPKSRSRKSFKQLTTYLLQAHLYDLTVDVINLARIENKEFDNMIYFEAMAHYLAGTHNEAIMLFEHALHLNADQFKIVYKFIPNIIDDASVMYLLDMYRS